MYLSISHGKKLPFYLLGSLLEYWLARDSFWARRCTRSPWSVCRWRWWRRRQQQGPSSPSRAPRRAATKFVVDNVSIETSLIFCNYDNTKTSISYLQTCLSCRLCGHKIPSNKVKGTTQVKICLHFSQFLNSNQAALKKKIFWLPYINQYLAHRHCVN